MSLEVRGQFPFTLYTLTPFTISAPSTAWDETLMLDLLMRRPCPPRKVLQPRWKTGSHDLLNNSDEEVNRKGGEVVH